MLKILFQKRSRFLVILLFLLAIAVPLLMASVSYSTPVSKTPLNIPQQIEQAEKTYQAGQFEDAAVLWQQIIDITKESGDRLNQSIALSNLALTDQQLGQWDEAQKAITASLTLLESLPNSSERQTVLAASLDIQGQQQLAIGQPENALETWQSATTIYGDLGDKQGIFRSEINQAQALQNLGLYPRACQTLLKTLEFPAQTCEISVTELQNLPEQDLPLQILGLRSLGNVLRVIGQTGQSQIVLLKSIELAKKLDNYSDFGAIYLSLGNTIRSLGNKKVVSEVSLTSPVKNKLINSKQVDCLSVSTDRKSFEYYQQAADCYHLAELAKSPKVVIQAQLNLLNLSLQNQQQSTISTLLKTLPTSIDRLPTSRVAIAARLKFAQNLLCLQSQLSPEISEKSSPNNSLQSPIFQSCPSLNYVDENDKFNVLGTDQIPTLAEIQKQVKVAFAQAQSLGDKKAEANALGYLAALAQQTRNLKESQQLTEQALQQLATFNSPELSYLWQWQLGRLHRLNHQTEAAIAAYTLAFQNLQSLRQDLVATNPDIQFTFRDGVEPVYRELVDLLLQPSPNRGEISQANLKKARNVIEALQLAEINNFFQEACLEDKPKQIEQLDSQAAVIYSIILPERLAIILSISDQPLRYYATSLNSSVNEAEIERTFEDLFASLNPFITNPNPLVPNQKLYNWLIRPAETALTQNNIQTLVFVLDGVLRNVPISALHDGKQYLIEKYNLALTPGLQLFGGNRFAPEKLSALVGGLTEPIQGFSALPSVKKEVDEIARITASNILLNSNFTSSQLEKALKFNQFSIVHLATHGQFSSQAENTFLLTWDKKINVKNLDQLLREQPLVIKSPIELLILSACQTAVGDKRAALGLAGVAVRSGARSTIATLWSIQDESTADLMTQFYQALNQPQVSKANALRQAQLSLLHSPQYQHPFYWSSFVLVGNWL
ncbi:MAG: CHAT domain-containing protein [Snowella sp.]|nr:CHAT domain-containing protein [Snowella sp.]